MSIEGIDDVQARFSEGDLDAARELIAGSEVLRDDPMADYVVSNDGMTADGIEVPDLGDFLYARQAVLQEKQAKTVLDSYRERNPENYMVVYGEATKV